MVITQVKPGSSIRKGNIDSSSSRLRQRRRHCYRPLLSCVCNICSIIINTFADAY